MNKVFDILVKLSAIDNMSKVVSGAVNKSQASLSRFGANASKLGDSLIGAGMGAGAMATAMALPLIKMVKDAEDGEKAIGRLTQVFKSMGEETGVAAQKANELADSLMYKIGVDADDIMAVQAKLATFENVIKNSSGSSEVFERATKAAFDLAAAGFGDAAGNAVQLGKALQDPIKGITALSKSGVTFTAAEKQKIQTMVQSGKMFEAQQFLLAAVEKQVGGTAAATVSSTQKMSLAFGEISGEIGKGLLPVFKTMADFLVNTAVPAVKSFVEENKPLLQTLGAVAVGITGVVAAGAAMSIMVGGVLKAVSYLTTAFNAIVSVVGFVSKAFMVLTRVLMANPFIAIIAGIVALIMYWDEVKAMLKKMAPFARATLQAFVAPFLAAFNVIKSIFNNIITAIQDALTGIWNAITSFNPIEALAQVFGGIWDFFADMAQSFFEAGANLVKMIGDGIWSAVSYPVEAIKGVVSSVRDYLPFSPAKVGPLSDLDKLKFGETIAQGIKPEPVVTAMNSAMQQVRPAANPAPGFMQAASFFQNPTPSRGGAGAPMASAGAGGGGGVVLHFNPTISVQGSGSSLKEDLMRIMEDSAVEFVRIIERQQARNNRKKF